MCEKLNKRRQTRYFAAFAASLSATVGVAFAADLLVLFVFYELLTVSTSPLVMHDETEKARAAGRKYLAYTFDGGVAILAGTVLAFWLTGSTTFTTGGIAALSTADLTFARVAFVLPVMGFGVKAALMPLHSWLPEAMVAPTPVSGLLHAVAIVKSGVFGVARVVLDVFGLDLIGELGMGPPLAMVAVFTLLTASVTELRQDNLKRRLACSTVSQLSYIILGLAVLNPVALVGGLLHIPAHTLMKLTLFFCAGAVHVETRVDDISNMAGIGKRMPLTIAAFGVASFGMAGLPLVAGFVSKYFLLVGTVSTGGVVFALALLVSGVLKVVYFWPVINTAFFETPATGDEKPVVEGAFGGRIQTTEIVSDDVATSDGGGSSGDPTTGNEHGYATDYEGQGPLDLREATRHIDRDHGPDGSPASERRRWTGAETTWFMLGPILAVTAGSVVLGIVPDAAVFLQLVRHVVSGVTGVTV